MVRVLPFKAYRYNAGRISDFKDVISPPYDVIKGELVERLHSRSPYNISHIIKGERRDTDERGNNEYSRAREHLEKWIDQGILLREDKEAFYVYAQEFHCQGRHYTRWGFIGLIELEDFGTPEHESNEKFAGVLQHEETLPKDIEDRLNLLRATRANFGQIFVIYADPEGIIDGILAGGMEEEPVMTADDDLGVSHKLWAIRDENDIHTITAAMADNYAIIADGHHRYKTALAYYRENPESKGAGNRMMTFVNMSNPGLVVLPTHRLVQHIDGFDISSLIEKLTTDFDVELYGAGETAREKMFTRLAEDFGHSKHAFGIYGNDGKFYGLTLQDETVMDGIVGKSDAWKKLDVTILHTLILDRYLGINKEKLAAGTIGGGSFVEYIKGIGNAVGESIEKVDRGAQAVFFMNPTKVSEVEAVAGNFETMPQKSTFFYPKVYTGLTVNKLD